GLNLGIERGAEGAAEAAERAEERRHDLLAIFTVGYGAVDAEGGAIELDGLAIAQRHRRVREVRVREDAVNARGTVGHHRCAREELLLAIALRVGSAPLDVVQ